MFLELTHGMTNIARCKLYSLEELILRVLHLRARPEFCDVKFKITAASLMVLQKLSIHKDYVTWARKMVLRAMKKLVGYI